MRKADVMTQAGITRAQMRYWERLWPALQKKRRELAPAEAVALCALAQVVRDSQCNIDHLKPVANALFAAMADGDWQRFEHRRMLIALPGGGVQFLATNEPVTEWPESTVIAIDLGPHVRAIRARALGLPAEVRPGQMGLFEQRKRKGRGTPAEARRW